MLQSIHTLIASQQPSIMQQDGIKYPPAWQVFQLILSQGRLGRLSVDWKTHGNAQPSLFVDGVSKIKAPQHHFLDLHPPTTYTPTHCYTPQILNSLIASKVPSDPSFANAWSQQDSGGIKGALPANAQLEPRQLYHTDAVHNICAIIFAPSCVNPHIS